MPPEVASVIHVCLAAAPGFEQLRDEVEALGFCQTGLLGEDVRWTHADGHEVFLSYDDSQTVCSVWFDGEYQAEVSELTSLLTKDGYSAKAHTDALGTAWIIAAKRYLRLIVKEQDTKTGFGAGFRRDGAAKRVRRQRLGAALIVQRD